MNVKRLSCYAVALPLPPGGYTMSHGRHLTELQSTVVRVEADDGTVGYGETCTLGGNYIDAFPGGVRTAVHELAAVTLGCPVFEPAVLECRMEGCLQGNMSAKAVIDAAVWDLRGKLLGQPVSVLLGGVQQAQYPIFYPLALAGPEQMAQEAAAVQEEGYRCWQLKLGDDPNEDAERAQAVFDVVSEQASFITCDANAGWTTAEASYFLLSIAGARTFVEQPCPTIAQLADVRRRSPWPIIADEVVRTVSDLFSCVRMEAADAINIKPARVGGITRAARLRDTAQDLGLMFMIDDAMGSDIATAAVSHLAASSRPDNLLAASHLAAFSEKRLAISGGPALKDGVAQVPSGPGLGLEVDTRELGEPLFSVVSDG